MAGAPLASSRRGPSTIRHDAGQHDACQPGRTAEPNTSQSLRKGVVGVQGLRRIRFAGASEVTWIRIRRSLALCFAVSCFAVSCFAVSCFAVSCFAVSCLAVSCLAVSCLAVSCLAVSCLAVSCLRSRASDLVPPISCSRSHARAVLLRALVRRALLAARCGVSHLIASVFELRVAVRTMLRSRVTGESSALRSLT